MVTCYFPSHLQPGFRSGTSTRLDDRVHALEMCKNLPLDFLLQEIHPDLYPVHQLDDLVRHTNTTNVGKYGI